ncbi:hypothetical protein TVAG_157470 [Trichomonas vaginalis G3]|uniref:Right handed beta helix domain-containing protein n=1 Tax=Trichomonas vaginalis (strain ATCC PRA-98 / G3) TaxID=412133 RepID=A2E9L9_TRIV3|nr:hypothetical protein TVAGG3_0746250 [Trichomonas vaginalis G3]EAY10670.1 hypothetical protein TVAG_157470 [Trichomonas vaginalis G3]KAI5512188.1 hypothetical protein TVAGG3_0746250 [Trichomonas vaginalis G3]|eukprot:XP_001322893.1 hypothetical protein [Trichomonas vaginalis G3]
MNTSYHYEITEYAAYEIGFSTEIGVINFTTASNTSSTELDGMYNLGDFNIIKCNYLYNECTGDDAAIIDCDTSCTYSNCSFIGNKGYCLFDEEPYLDNCYFDNKDVTQTVWDGYSGTFESINPLDSFISHYAVEGCPSTYFYKKEESEKTLKMKDIENIIINILLTSFVVTVNISSSKIV